MPFNLFSQMTMKNYGIFRWKEALHQRAFLLLFTVGLAIVLVILNLLPHYFYSIEQRIGFVLHDTILQSLPAIDLSKPIFIIIWISALLTIIRCLQSPIICILFIWGFLFLTLSRLLTIWCLPLQPPPHLIPLTDPLSNHFYGNKYITKDLFYSGHTATQFLMFLCLQKRFDKLFTLLSTIVIGLMVLVQHVHYTVDVIAAPICTFIMFLIAKKLVDTVLKRFA